MLSCIGKIEVSKSEDYVLITFQVVKVHAMENWQLVKIKTV